MPGPDRAGHLPNLVLAGVTKAGTTSLHTYFQQHPDVFVPREKELNFFSPLVHGKPLPDLAGYRGHYREAGEEPWRLDASPFYFTGGAPLADAVAATLDRPRVLVSLRDPVARLWSSYTYKKSKGYLATSETFADFFEECERHYLRGTDRLPENVNLLTLRSGLYADFLPAWLDRFGHDLRIVFAEDLGRSPATVMAGLFGWLGIDQGAAGGLDYSRRNATAQPRSRRLRRLAHGVNARLKPVLAGRPAVHRVLHGAYDRLNSTSLAEHLTTQDRARAQEFYAPSVARLAALLERAGVPSVPSWVTAR